MAASVYPSLLRRLALLDYPLPLKLHAYLLLTLGIGLTFTPEFIVSNPLFTIPTRYLSLPQEVTSTPSSSSKSASSLPPSSKRSLSLAGLLALGLGLSYVGTSAFVASPQQNQLLYAAIPLRYAMSGAALASWIGDKESRNIFKLTVILEDFVGATWLVWWMRDWPLWQGFRW